jgi:hypothetical protein
VEFRAHTFTTFHVDNINGADLWNPTPRFLNSRDLWLGFVSSFSPAHDGNWWGIALDGFFADLFFADNNVVAFFVGHGSGGRSIDVHSVSTNGTISLGENRGRACTAAPDVVMYTLVVIELPKSFIPPTLNVEVTPIIAPCVPDCCVVVTPPCPPCNVSPCICGLSNCTPSYCADCLGFLTNPCLCRLANCPRAFPCDCRILVQVPPIPPVNVASRIIADWVRLNNIHQSEVCGINPMWFGVYNDSFAVFRLETAVRAALWSETVAGFEFNYNHSYRIRIYNNGEFYTLNEALAAGLITADNVRDIWTRFAVRYHNFRV